MVEIATWFLWTLTGSFTTYRNCFENDTHTWHIYRSAMSYSRLDTLLRRFTNILNFILNLTHLLRHISCLDVLIKYCCINVLLFVLIFWRLVFSLTVYEFWISDRRYKIADETPFISSTLLKEVGRFKQNG